MDEAFIRSRAEEAVTKNCSDVTFPGADLQEWLYSCAGCDDVHCDHPTHGDDL